LAPDVNALRVCPTLIRFFVVATVLAVALPVAEAAGDPGPPGDVSAVSQYVEMVPTSNGSTATGVSKPKVKPLPRRLDTKLQKQAGKSARALVEVATSSSYGAPQHDLAPVRAAPPATQSKTNPATRRRAPRSLPATHLPLTRPAAAKPKSSLPKASTAINAAFSAISAARLIGLLVALLLIASTLLLAAGSRWLPRQTRRHIAE
jgi:hypothetical protein